MSFEHFSRPLRRAVAHTVTLQAAQKIKAVFGGDLRTALKDVRRAAERASAAEEHLNAGAPERPEPQ
jgi:hypothetical protein